MARPSGNLLRLVLVGGLLGCAGPGGGDGAPIDGKADGFGDEVASLDGSYALVIESRVESRDGDGVVSDHTTVFWARADLEGEGAEVRLSIAPCALDLPRFDGRDASLDAAVLESQPPIEVGGLLSTSEGATSLSTDPAALLLGVTLDDPVADSMPTDGDDPRVSDADRDGEPGVTFLMGGWEVYAALRVTFSLVGLVSEGGGVTGEVDLDDELQIFDDDIPFFSARNALEEAAAESETLSEVDRFALVPLDAGTEPSCGAVLSIPNPLL